MWLYARPGNQTARGKPGGGWITGGVMVVETVAVEVSRLLQYVAIYSWVLGGKRRTRFYTAVLRVFEEYRSRVEKFSPKMWTFCFCFWLQWNYHMNYWIYYTSFYLFIYIIVMESMLFKYFETSCNLSIARPDWLFLD